MQCAPEVFAKLEGRLNNESTLSALSGPYLSTLAWAFAGAGAGSPEFLKAVGKAAAGKQLEKSSKANLAWALEKAGLDAAPFKE